MVSNTKYIQESSGGNGEVMMSARVSFSVGVSMFLSRKKLNVLFFACGERELTYAW